MRFNDSYFNKDERFSIGIEESSGKFYISIPVSNGMVDYEEYFEIDKNTFESYIENPGLALPFVIRCRNREVDNLLIIQPGRDRGVATQAVIQKALCRHRNIQAREHYTRASGKSVAQSEEAQAQQEVRYMSVRLGDKVDSTQAALHR